MALDLKLDVHTTDDCKNLVIQDITGVYNDSSNPGGWGEFNITGDRGTYNLQAYLRVYHFIEGDQYVTAIDIPNFASTVNYPAEDTYRGFKISIPSYDISTAVSTTSLVPESYNSMQDVLEDTLYDVVINLNSSDPFYNKEFIIEFKSICNSAKAVEKMMGTINLGCEDCDESDIENALLAKSLLETLKTME
mgnify:CR=1 FL=1|tara:strand:+ start:139 stop:714 length:576 start_codon:yes stop_codon:yes gene_type:complete